MVTVEMQDGLLIVFIPSRLVVEAERSLVRMALLLVARRALDAPVLAGALEAVHYSSDSMILRERLFSSFPAAFIAALSFALRSSLLLIGHRPRTEP